MECPILIMLYIVLSDKPVVKMTDEIYKISKLLLSKNTVVFFIILNT